MRCVKVAVPAIILLFLVLATVQRNAVWHTLLTMWTDCAAKSSQKSRTHNNLGNCYLLLGKHFPAIAEYQKAVGLDNTNMQAQYNLATQLDNVGLSSLAARHYEVFCRFAPPTFPEQKKAACRRFQELNHEMSTESKRR